MFIRTIFTPITKVQQLLRKTNDRRQQPDANDMERPVSLIIDISTGAVFLSTVFSPADLIQHTEVQKKKIPFKKFKQVGRKPGKRTALLFMASLRAAGQSTVHSHSHSG